MTDREKSGSVEEGNKMLKHIVKDQKGNVINTYNSCKEFARETVKVFTECVIQDHREFDSEGHEAVVYLDTVELMDKEEIEKELV